VPPKGKNNIYFNLNINGNFNGSGQECPLYTED
jgi:hypothetical protein